MSATLPSAEIEPDHGGSLAAHARKDWLRFITCGSVDDGKSTLIGRLLIETGAVYSDQLLALRRDTSKHGTTGESLDAALLVDGLEDERQQGITIDVAYRYFSTPRRKFMIADTPGHEQFTRNMATGASQADVALILVDASQGLLTQTRRHAFIVSLLGIQQVILVVNKMDLVNYQAPVFQRITAEFCGFAEQLKLTRIHCLPLSALKGDNLVQPSPLMPWYEGLPLLGLLESVEVHETASHDALRFPVQWVNRPSADFRGFSGSLVSGSIRVGDEVLVQPSNLRTRVRGILNGTSYCNQATAPQSVTLTLTDEIDVTRGDMLVAVDQPPQVSRSAAAMVLWMSEQSLATERSYWVKQSTKRTSGVVSHIHYGLNVNTLERFATTTLQLNDIALCELKFHDPLVFDAYRQNRHTGSFILVDRLTHETVAAGMLVTRQSEDGGADYWFAEPISGQLREAVSRITSLQRQRCYGHPPFTILLTGLSGSGKTSLALAAGRAVVLGGTEVPAAGWSESAFGNQPRSGIHCRGTLGEPEAGGGNRQVGQSIGAGLHRRLRGASCRHPPAGARANRARQVGAYPFVGATGNLPTTRLIWPLCRRRSGRNCRLPRHYPSLYRPGGCRPDPAHGSHRHGVSSRTGAGTAASSTTTRPYPVTDLPIER